MDQLPRLGKRELICLLLFTCNCVVSVGEVFSSSWCLGCATLFYCGTPSAIHIIISYTLEGTDVENVESINILGVTITSNLKWNSHIRNVCTKANRTLVFMRRNLFSCPQDVNEAAYKSLGDQSLSMEAQFRILIVMV